MEFKAYFKPRMTTFIKSAVFMKPVKPGSSFPADFLTPQQEGQLEKLIAGTELQEIEQAVQGTTAGQPVFVHFSKALAFLSSQQTPNYRQAVLEAIAAVDYVMGQFSSRRVKEDVSAPLNTSSLLSIRHVLGEGGIALSFEKARYWLVACASLINHFKAIAH